MADPINDLLFTDPDPPADPDIIAVAGRVRGPDLKVSVEFKPGTFLQPPGAGTTGMGIYLDTDRNPDTGGRGISDVSGVDAANMGWEYLILLQGANDSGVFRYLGPTTMDVEISGVVLSTFTADGFSMTIPLSIIGTDDLIPDDGILALKVASFQFTGVPGEPVSGLFDVAPDIGLPALSVLNGDYNDDGIISTADYHSWQHTYGTTVGTPGSGADGNGDGIVNAADYVIWRNNYEAAGSGAISNIVTVSIPEPCALSLVFAVGLIASVASRRSDR